MQRDDIERMAREAKGHAYTNRHTPGETAFAFSIDRLEHFVSLVVAQEREECAKVCDKRFWGTDHFKTGTAEAKGCAAAIRARSQQ